MGFPSEGPPRRSTDSPIHSVSELLRKNHPGRYMVWNLSEEAYDADKWFEGQVQEFKFPGHPAPPLAVLFQIIFSIESHKGKGRPARQQHRLHRTVQGDEPPGTGSLRVHVLACAGRYRHDSCVRTAGAPEAAEGGPCRPRMNTYFLFRYLYLDGYGRSRS